MRVPAKHAWPLVMNPAAPAVGMVLSSSASSRMIVGDLPPNSSVMRLQVSAPARRICFPTAVEPVNEIFATSGCDASKSPTVSPRPVKMLMTPGGRRKDDIGLDGAHLAGFHDRSAAGGESGRDLRADEACVAIPGRDESGDADRSHEDSRGAGFPFEIVGFENRRGVGERLHRVAGRGLGALLRGAILLHRSQHDILLPAFDFSMQPPEHVDAFAF